MSACIRVESGISAGTSYWIDRPVLRIGSDPQCEICLPTADLAGHAMTLEFRNGAYRAYNRGNSPVSVGAEVLQPGGNALWQADDTAHLPGGVRLLLEVDGDSRPSPRPESLVADSVVGVGQYADVVRDAGAAATEPAKKSSGTMIQLAVIGFCMLATVAFLTMKRGGTKATSNRPTFDSIVKASLEKKGGVSRKLLPRLQFAQSAVVRGDSKLAKERFSVLRDQLVSQIDTLSADDRKDAEVVLDYVEYQLGRLN